MKRLLFPILALCALSFVDSHAAVADDAPDSICMADTSLTGMLPGDGAIATANPYTNTLAVPTSVAAGASKDFSYIRSMRLVVGGTFVATIQLQTSVDGTNWAKIGSDITATGVTEITGNYKLLRINTSAFTSGAPLAWIVGLDDRDMEFVLDGMPDDSVQIDDGVHVDVSDVPRWDSHALP